MSRNVELLPDYLQRCYKKPFKWGEHDCCMFAANGILLITGIDFAEKFRGKYSTEMGAAIALKRYGEGNLSATLHAIFGEPIAPLLAKRGDIALIDNAGQPAAALVFNGLWFVGADGLVKADDCDAIHFWSVSNE